MKKITLLLFLIISVFTCAAQNTRVITGTVTDSQSDVALPFANVSLKKQLIGTITNENGEFNFLIPENTNGDTLIINFLGYKKQYFFVDTIKQNMYIKLQASSLALQEVVIHSKTPVYYIQLAVYKLKENYPQKAFSTEAYFSEKILENNQFLKHNEAVFKTYYPDNQDTTQNKLLLYRVKTDVKKIDFMKDKRKKEEAKDRKKALKKGEEYNENEDELIDIKGMFGGPRLILEASQTKSSDSFLDSTNFKKFEYTFSEKSTVDLMIINFVAKKYIDKIKSSGTIYIDFKSDAIVAIDYKGKIRIPMIVKPVLFLLGIGLEKPDVIIKRKYREINHQWYPESTRLTINLTITKKHLFKTNEHSSFEFKQLYSVTKIEVDNPKVIPLKKIFKSSEGFENQDYNDDKLKWENINVVRN